MNNKRYKSLLKKIKKDKNIILPYDKEQITLEGIDFYYYGINITESILFHLEKYYTKTYYIKNFKYLYDNYFDVINKIKIIEQNYNLNIWFTVSKSYKKISNKYKKQYMDIVKDDLESDYHSIVKILAELYCEGLPNCYPFSLMDNYIKPLIIKYEMLGLDDPETERLVMLWEEMVNVNSDINIDNQPSVLINKFTISNALCSGFIRLCEKQSFDDKNLISSMEKIKNIFMCHLIPVVEKLTKIRLYTSLS